jgi:hypothetical protein
VFVLNALHSLCSKVFPLIYFTPVWNRNKWSKWAGFGDEFVYKCVFLYLFKVSTIFEPHLLDKVRV